MFIVYLPPYLGWWWSQVAKTRIAQVHSWGSLQMAVDTKWFKSTLENSPKVSPSYVCWFSSLLSLSFSLFLSLSLTIYLSTYLSIYLSLSLSVCLSVYLQALKRSNSARLQFLNLTTSKTQQFCEKRSNSAKNAAILRDVLSFWTWQHQKRSNSARLPQFLNLTTSKMKQFCETASILELDNVKNEAILRDFLIFFRWQHQKRSKSARLPHFFPLTTSKTKQFCETSFKNGKLSAELTASYWCVQRFFDSTCLNYCACHEKVMPGHTKCCTCHAKSSQQTWRSDAPKCNPSQEISARTS